MVGHVDTRRRNDNLSGLASSVALLRFDAVLDGHRPPGDVAHLHDAARHEAGAQLRQKPAQKVLGFRP